MGDGPMVNGCAGIWSGLGWRRPCRVRLCCCGCCGAHLTVPFVDSGQRACVSDVTAATWWFKRRSLPLVDMSVKVEADLTELLTLRSQIVIEVLLALCLADVDLN